MTEHIIFGFSVSEWVGIITIIGGVYTFIARPLINKLTTLSKSIDRVSDNAKTEHDRLWRHYDKHDRQIWEHDRELDVLYDQTHLTRPHVEIKKEEQNHED